MSARSGINVLIVDDDDLDIFLLQKSLADCGIQNIASVTAGESAEKYLAGLEPYSNRPVPDLIFLDLRIADFDGFELIPSVKQNPMFKQSRLIVLTGSKDELDREKALALGATAFFQKTAESEKVKAMLEEAIARTLS